MDDPHPSLESLVSDPLPKEVAEHLEGCPKCRVDARLYARVASSDPDTLEGIDRARSTFEAIEQSSMDLLSRTFEPGLDETAGLHPGQVVDRYVVEQRIGAGGMATVYRVRHLRLDSLHALKVMHRITGAERERLTREGRAQGRLRHPNVVAVTDVVDIDGAPGLIMEYIDGPTLAAHLAARGAPPLEEADRLAWGILRGVSTAHRAGLVHRDLKPGNVLLAPGDDGYVPKVTDFGLVRSVEVGGDTRLTRKGTPMGTPSYMAPEQLTDASSADVRSDVFSLGAVLYELVTGRRAFPGLRWLDIADRIRAGRYQRPQSVVPELPARMARTIERCLAVDPADRFGDCDAVLASWAPDGLSGPAPAPVRWSVWRTAIALAVAAVALGVVLVFGVTAGWFASDLRSPQPTAFWESDDADAQAAMEEGWERFLDADLEGAQAYFLAATEEAPDAVMPRLMWGVSLDLAGEQGRAMSALEEASALAGDRADLESALARLMHHSMYPPVQAAGWEELLRAHPDDFLVHLLAARAMPGTHDEASAHARRAMALRPDAPIAHYVLGDVARRHARWNHMVMAWMRTSRRPVAPRLTPAEHMGAIGWTLAKAHNPGRPYVETTVFAANPDDNWHRYRISVELGEEGDEGGRDRQLALVFSEATARSDRVGLARLDARYEFGRGRWQAAWDRLEGCRASAADRQPAQDEILCLDTQVRLALLGSDATALGTALDGLTTAAFDATGHSRAGELGRRMASGLVYLKGRRALLQGRPAEARESAANLRAMDRPAWWLDAGAAADDLVRRMNPAEEYMNPLPGAELDEHSERGRMCRRHAEWGRLLHAHEHPVASFELADAVEQCEPIFEERYLLARSHLLLAERALDGPDLSATVDHLGWYWYLWPDPDPEHPLAARAEQVEDTLVARFDAEAARAYDPHETRSFGDTAYTLRPCRYHAQWSRVLQRVDPTEAERALTTAIDTCDTELLQRQVLADSHLRLAEIALDRDDLTVSGDHLAWSRWFLARPGPHHPVRVRADRLDAELEARMDTEPIVFSVDDATILCTSAAGHTQGRRVFTQDGQAQLRYPASAMPVHCLVEGSGGSWMVDLDHPATYRCSSRGASLECTPTTPP